MIFLNNSSAFGFFIVVVDIGAKIIDLRKE
jgi:hypothetical protein